MSDKLWFKSKKFGWGWTPSSKEGFIVTGVWLFVFGLSVACLTHHPILLICSNFIEIAVLLWICYRKGEEIPYLPKKKKSRDD